MKKKNNNGLLCPECKFPMEVYYTRPMGDHVKRVRICKRCGYKKPTTEK